MSAKRSERELWEQRMKEFQSSGQTQSDDATREMKAVNFQFAVKIRKRRKIYIEISKTTCKLA